MKVSRTHRSGKSKFSVIRDNLFNPNSFLVLSFTCSEFERIPEVNVRFDKQTFDRLSKIFRKANADSCLLLVVVNKQ